MGAFLRNTLLGGLFVVLPVTLTMIVLGQAWTSIRAAMAPIAAALPFEAMLPGLWALLALVLLSFVAGLLLKVPPVRDWTGAFFDRLAEKFPVVQFLRGVQQGLVDKSGQTPLKAALAETGDGLVPAFVVEELGDGRCVVYVPSVPNVLQGAVYVMDRERVHRVDASLMQVTRCVSKWGLGTKALVAAMRKPA